LEILQIAFADTFSKTEWISWKYSGIHFYFTLFFYLFYFFQN
jgi:hypothetical protein